jgi:hypothetical protein
MVVEYLFEDSIAPFLERIRICELVIIVGGTAFVATVCGSEQELSRTLFQRGAYRFVQWNG